MPHPVGKRETAKPRANCDPEARTSIFPVEVLHGFKGAGLSDRVGPNKEKAVTDDPVTPMMAQYLEIKGENQRGELTTPGMATVILPCLKPEVPVFFDGRNLSLDLPVVR